MNVEYIDGTKIESKANKYTFVWRKTVERNRERLMKKIHILLGQIDNVIAQENSSESNEEIEFTPAMLDVYKRQMKCLSPTKATFRMITVFTAHGLRYSTNHMAAPTLQVAI